MREIDCIKFIDDATGAGISVAVFQRDDALVMVDFQLANKSAAVLSLPCDLARRLADALLRAIPA